MQAVLEFGPPLPKSDLEAKYTNPGDLLLIVGDDRFETDSPRPIPFETREEAEGTLEVGEPPFRNAHLSKVCVRYAGREKCTPLFLEYVPRRTTARLGMLATTGLLALRSFRKSSLICLTSDERGRLELLAVTGKVAGQAVFYELVGNLWDNALELLWGRKCQMATLSTKCNFIIKHGATVDRRNAHQLLYCQGRSASFSTWSLHHWRPT